MRGSILTTLQPQKSKIFLWVLAGLALFLLIRIATRSLWSYNSIIATPPATKSAHALLQTLVERYNSSHALSKLSLSETSTFNESTSVSKSDSIDFAVIAPGTPIPHGFEVIASLNEEKVVLLSAQGNHFEQLKDIRSAVIAIVNIHEYDEMVLRKVLGFFEIPEQSNTITTMTLDQFLASKILANRMVYAFFFHPLSSTSHTILKTKGQKGREKLEVIDIDLADLTDDSPLFFSSTIKKGELSIHPLLPNEEMDTVSALTYLVARTSVREEVITRLLTFLHASTRVLPDKGAIEAFFTVEGISESKNIPFHSGYKKFLSGENEGFFQKNADIIYIVGVGLAALSSVMYSHYKKLKKKADDSSTAILAAFADFEKYCLYDVPLEEKKNLAQVNDRMCKLILHRSNKKTMLTNTLIALMVLTNIANTMRNNDHS